MKKNRRQVNANKYDIDYYTSLYKSPDYNKKIDLTKFGHIYQNIASLTNISSNQSIVDFGCGNGELGFYLYLKTKCSVIGIDYSGDAIKIANQHLKKLVIRDKNAKEKIKFISKNNNRLPILKVDQVYFCDVLEHLYDEEVNLVLKKAKSWQKNNSIVFAVHTDNDLFLKYIRPILDIISVITFSSKMSDISARNKWEKERHVNLSNPYKMRAIMRQFGFEQIAFKYPDAGLDKIRNQLGRLSRIPLMDYVIYGVMNISKSFSPSFFAAYKLINMKNARTQISKKV